MENHPFEHFLHNLIPLMRSLKSSSSGWTFFHISCGIFWYTNVLLSYTLYTTIFFISGTLTWVSGGSNTCLRWFYSSPYWLLNQQLLSTNLFHGKASKNIEPHDQDGFGVWITFNSKWHITADPDRSMNPSLGVGYHQPEIYRFVCVHSSSQKWRHWH